MELLNTLENFDVLIVEDIFQQIDIDKLDIICQENHYFCEVLDKIFWKRRMKVYYDETELNEINNYINNNLENSLFYAIDNYNIDLIKYLLFDNQYKYINKQNDDNNTALAVVCKDIDFYTPNIINLLLNNGADPNIYNWDGNTPLMILLFNYQDIIPDTYDILSPYIIDIINKFINNNIPVDLLHKNNYNQTLLLSIINIFTDENTTSNLLNYVYNYGDNDDDNDLLINQKFPIIEIVNILLKNNSDPNVQDNYNKYTCLMLICNFTGFINIDWLSKQHYDQGLGYIEDKFRDTIVEILSKIMELLLDYNANPLLTDRNNRTAYMIAKDNYDYFYKEKDNYYYIYEKFMNILESCS